MSERYKAKQGWFVCLDCGVVVVDDAAHDEDHDRIDRLEVNPLTHTSLPYAKVEFDDEHDPMCPTHATAEECLSAHFPFTAHGGEPICPTPCQCDLIARVRADCTRKHGSSLLDTYANGYARALRDAVEAVKALDGYFDWQRWQTVAAIEALNENQA